MLEKPDIPDELIISRLRDEYNLRASALVFLPLGADLGTAVYRVTTEDGTGYFLKLRKGFEEITVTVPFFLKAQGIEAIIAPIETRSKRYWADFGEYTMILYPFIEGQDGFERELTDMQRRTLGVALHAIHSSQPPPDLRGRIPQETYTPKWRERLKAFQVLIKHKTFDDPTAVRLAEFMKSRSNEINRLVERTQQLATEVRSDPLDFVLCHTDIHGGNIVMSHDDSLYIVDWDNPLLAPKERDLMFIGGGIDKIWRSERDMALFYDGYGKTEIHLPALAYYRYERIIEDLAVIGEQLFLSDGGEADRERSYGWFTSNFEPGHTIEIAQKTDRLQ